MMYVYGMEHDDANYGTARYKTKVGHNENSRCGCRWTLETSGIRADN